MVTPSHDADVAASLDEKKVAPQPFSSNDDEEEESIQQAIDLLTSIGVPRTNLCIKKEEDPSTPKRNDARLVGLLDDCDDSSMNTTTEEYYKTGQTKSSNSRRSSSWPIQSRRQRWLGETETTAAEEDPAFVWSHILGALLCTVTAAMAAGLTMGLLSLDPLLLLIKMRASSSMIERKQAASILPIVQQHHLLLVTLLLLNSMANEALPLCLEPLVSPLMAVLLSVTLVLFFGEIIPSAIFTGPNKIALAAKMTPLVRLVMAVLWPIAYPIAKLLDIVLHGDHNHDDSETEHDDGDGFNRGELCALVRIQYEERMAAKQLRKKAKAELRNITNMAAATGAVTTDQHVGGLDFSLPNAVRASKREMERRRQEAAAAGEGVEVSDVEDGSRLTPSTPRAVSIHVDEVSMVEGALSMKTKVALDVFTPLHRMVAMRTDTILNEQAVVDIYSSGYSRIPVYDETPGKPKSRAAIRGILMTKQLIVINPQESRPLNTLPLSTPQCVSPKRNLVDLLNLFQTGKVGHLALVCARPQVGQDALQSGLVLPEAAGFMGVISLEDVLEALLQEQIYDENDKMEKEAIRRAKWAVSKWKQLGKKRKNGMGDVVQSAMAAGEGTALLGDPNASSNDSGGGAFLRGLFG